MNRSIIVGTPDGRGAGRPGRRDDTTSAPSTRPPAAIQRRTMSAWAGVSGLPALGGGIRSSGSSEAIRSQSSLSSGLPGTTTSCRRPSGTGRRGCRAAGRPSACWRRAVALVARLREDRADVPVEVNGRAQPRRQPGGVRQAIAAAAINQGIACLGISSARLLLRRVAASAGVLAAAQDRCGRGDEACLAFRRARPARPAVRECGRGGVGSARDQDIVDFRLFQMAVRPRIVTVTAPDRSGHGASTRDNDRDADHDPSPEPLQRPSTRYRDRTLMVTRGTPLARGRDPDAHRDQLRAALPARDGGLAGPLRAVRRRDLRRDPARSALQSHRRPLARPRRRPARGVLLRLPGRRPQGPRPPLRSRTHPARPVRAGPLLRPALGDRRGTCPAAA